MNMLWEAKLSYRKHGLKGLFNYFLSKVDFVFRPQLSLSNPIMLNIIIVENMCNLSCAICYPFQPALKKELSFEAFKKIFDKFKYVICLNLTGHGESFMLKDLFKMIDYAKSRNCDVGLITNMTLVNESVAEEVVKSKLSYLGISMDAATPELFEKIRQGAKFEAVIDNIRILNDIKKRYNSHSPELFFQTTLMKENIQELPKIVELASQLGINKIYTQPMIPLGMGLATEEQSITNYPELAESIFLSAQKKAKELGVNFIYHNHRRHKINFFNICIQPWTMAYVTIDGFLLPCCNHFPAVGNIFKDDIIRIWNSKVFRSIRKTVKKERSICYYCIKSLDQLGLKQ